MSVRTQADEKLDQVQRHLRDAIDNLFDIVVTKIWGYKDFTSEYRKALHDSLSKLIEVDRDLFSEDSE